jgi:hypothetical protein
LAAVKATRACADVQALECCLCLRQIDGPAALLVIGDEVDVATAPTHVRCALDLLSAVALPAGMLLTRPLP